MVTTEHSKKYAVVKRDILHMYIDCYVATVATNIDICISFFNCYKVQHYLWLCKLPEILSDHENI